MLLYYFSKCISIHILRTLREGQVLSIIYHIDKEKRITLAVWDGAITEEKLLAHSRKLLADPDWPGKRRLHLSDLGTTSAYINIDEISIKKVLAFLGKFPNKIAKEKMAMVANEAYQMSNIFQRLISKYPLTVIAFNSLDTACTWLDIDADESECALQQLRAKAREGTDTQGQT